MRDGFSTESSGWRGEDPDFRSLRYLVRPSPGREGDVLLTARRRSEFSRDPRISGPMLARGLRWNSRIVEIESFFPNGDPPNGSFAGGEPTEWVVANTRRGIGTLLLARIVADSARIRARALLVRNVSPAMVAFCLKHGFEPLMNAEDPTDDCYFLPLEPDPK